MASVSTYLNFDGTTEAAFNFYRDVFGTEFDAPVQYMRDIPMAPGQTPLAEDEQGRVMHVSLPILAGHRLMGTDTIKSMGDEWSPGNTMSINLQPDTRAETDRLFAALSEGGEPEMAPQEMFWGDYFGYCVDRFGTRWMFNCSEPAAG
ncbi:MAG: VOC family protein [Baekduia sp.]